MLHSCYTVFLSSSWTPVAFLRGSVICVQYSFSNMDSGLQVQKKSHLVVTCYLLRASWIFLHIFCVIFALLLLSDELGFVCRLEPYADPYYDYEIERLWRGGQYENFRVQYTEAEPYHNYRVWGPGLELAARLISFIYGTFFFFSFAF